MSTLEALLPLFEPETLARLTSKKAFAAGQELFEAGRTVTDIVFDGGHLRGKVKGSHPMPHQTGLKLQPDGTLEASCSCPTYTDGWEKICQHAVALALTLRKQYQTGADITRTQNPWVQDLGSGSSASRSSRPHTPHALVGRVQIVHALVEAGGLVEQLGDLRLRQPAVDLHGVVETEIPDAPAGPVHLTVPGQGQGGRRPDASWGARCACRLVALSLPGRMGRRAFGGHGGPGAAAGAGAGARPVPRPAVVCMGSAPVVALLLLLPQTLALTPTRTRARRCCVPQPSRWPPASPCCSSRRSGQPLVQPLLLLQALLRLLAGRRHVGHMRASAAAAAVTSPPPAAAPAAAAPAAAG